MFPVLLPVMLSLAMPIDPARFEASVAVGAGYDGNLALAPSGTSQASIGTTTLSAWASGGWSLPLGPLSRLYAGLRYEGVLCLDASDLTRNVPGADLGLTHVFNRWLAAFVTANGGYAFYGDPARSGPRLGGRLVLRVRPADHISIRVGYARTQSWADDPVFSLGTNRLLASVEVQAARSTYLAAGYTFGTGDQVFYRTVVTLPPGRIVGHRGTGNFATLEPYQANAQEHTLTLRVEQGIGDTFHVVGTYDHTRGFADEGQYVVNSFFLALGVRF